MNRHVIGFALLVLPFLLVGVWMMCEAFRQWPVGMSVLVVIVGYFAFTAHLLRD